MENAPVSFPAVTPSVTPSRYPRPKNQHLPPQSGSKAMMHNHDTNETFIPMTGTWRASWENESGEVEYVDLGPLDVVSFPPGMIRRFENVTKGDPNQESILMFVIGGDGPRAEFTDQAMHQLEAAGVWPQNS
jgi:hypothetical protein